MAARPADWKKAEQDLRAARAKLADAVADVNRWELLAGGTAQQRGERQAQGARIRAKASELKLELERLQRELDGLARTAVEAVRPMVDKLQADLAQALADHTELQRRLKGSAAGLQAASAAGAGGAAAANGHFVPLAGHPPGPGAELQPVSQRSMLQQQQQELRDLEEPLAAIEGSVNNLLQVGRMIGSEIQLQNGMLERQNQVADRVVTRYGRVRALLDQVVKSQRNRCLMCTIFLLLVGLIVIFILVVLP